MFPDYLESWHGFISYTVLRFHDMPAVWRKTLVSHSCRQICPAVIKLSEKTRAKSDRRVRQKIRKHEDDLSRFKYFHLGLENDAETLFYQSSSTVYLSLKAASWPWLGLDLLVSMVHSSLDCLLIFENSKSQVASQYEPFYWYKRPILTLIVIVIS